MQPFAKAKPVDLRPELTLEEAFGRIASSCVTHLRANEACAAEGSEIEGVHQMRVATRRLRAAIRLFRSTLPAEWPARVKRELGWLGRALGPARDLDVFVEETLDPLRVSLPEEPSLAALAAATDRARAEAYGKVREAIADPRYAALLNDLDGAPPAVGDRTIGAEAPAILDRRDRRVRRTGKEIHGLPAEDLHRLRIRVKRERYAIEFLAGLYPGKRVRRFVGVLKFLQDLLGRMQDIAATTGLLDALAVEDRRGPGIVIGWQASAAWNVRAELVPAWKWYRKRDRFWRK